MVASQICSFGDYENILGINVNSLLYVVSQCKNKHDFKVGIFTNYKDTRIQCVDFIAKIIGTDMNRPCSILNCRSQSPVIRLYNGSVIRFPFPSDNARACRVHMLLIDDSVDKTIIHHVLNPLLIRYYPYDFQKIKVKYLGAWG